MSKTVDQSTTVMFNFCEVNVNTDDGNLPASCKDKPEAFAYGWKTSDETTCKPILSSSDAKPNTLAKDIYESGTENVNGVQLVF